MDVFTAAAAGTTSNLAWFIPTLAAAIVYFQYDVMDPESRPIDVPSELLLPAYDFIVVGSGSAGTVKSLLYFEKLLSIYRHLLGKKFAFY